jgi:hypothetical protein
MDNELEESLEKLHGLLDRHLTVGAALYEACEGHLFPCDSLAMTALDRSLNHVEGFLLLMRNHGYICCAALLRMQLDCTLRLYGVLNSGDPHGVAMAVIEGKRLNQIKDKADEQMHDSYLLTLLEPKNLGVTRVYGWASGYVHFSREHVAHFWSRSAPGPDGRRIIQIGNNDDHIPVQHRQELVDGFATVTRGVLSIIEKWIAARKFHGSREELHRRGFTAPI